MARVEMMHCKGCNQEVEIWVTSFNYKDICPKCESILAETIKMRALDELKKLPLEERLARIEEWIYDHGDGHPVDINRMMF